MKIIVFTDIHGNYRALEAAIPYLGHARPDILLFLGDYITDAPYPEKIMQMLYDLQRQYTCYFIRGNREDYLIQHKYNSNDGWCYASSCGSLLYTYEHLSETDMCFLENMPIVQNVYPTQVLPLTCCHGSPDSTKGWIMNNRILERKYIQQCGGSMLLCGHTHKNKSVEIGDKTILYCPSLGMPNDPNSDARFTELTWTGKRWLYSWQPLHYDKEAFIGDYEESGFLEKSKVWGHCVIHSLRYCIDSCMQCVALAWRYAKADHYNGSSILPEKYWEAAAKTLQILP